MQLTWKKKRIFKQNNIWKIVLKLSIISVKHDFKIELEKS